MRAEFTAEESLQILADTDMVDTGEDDTSEESFLEMDSKIAALSGFLQSVSVTKSMSASAVALLNLYAGSYILPSVEDCQDMAFNADAAVEIAREDFASSVARYSGKLGVMLGAPFVILMALDRKLERLTRESVSWAGRKLGLMRGKISKETATMIVRSVEGALGIGILYFSGLGGAMARVANSPRYASTYVGKFVQKISEFKWPFGSVRAAMRDSKRWILDFVWDTEDAVIYKQAAEGGWESVDAMSFMTKTSRVIKTGIRRLYEVMKSGISDFGRQVNGIVIEPIMRAGTEVGAASAARTQSEATGHLAAASMRLLGGFSLAMITRFIVTVLRKSISTLCSLFTSLVTEAKSLMKKATA